MRKAILGAIGLMILLSLLTSCNNTISPSGNLQVEDPLTNDNSNDFANSIPVKIDAAILQTCYEFAKFRGYEIGDKEKYTSVLLGKSNVTYVYVDDDDKKDMIDGGDYLITFAEIRIVIDSETGVALGTIPYV